MKLVRALAAVEFILLTALSQGKVWATTAPGVLTLGTRVGGWVVSEVKVKRLEAGKQ